MNTLNILVVLLVSVYVVNARPTETSVPSTTTESVDVRQGWNQGQQNGNSYPNRQQTGVGYSSNPIATGSYPAGSNGRPSYAYDNAFPDEVNFSGADLHRPIVSMFNMNIPSNGGFVANNQIPNNQLTGFAPTRFQASGGVSASASAVSVSS